MAKSPFDAPPRDVGQFLSQNKSFGTTQRYRDASKAEMYYWSLQYDGMQEWDSAGPLKKKRPKIIVPLFKTAVDTMTSFVWGGARFPKIFVQPTRRDDDKTDPNDVGPELYADDAKDLTTFVTAMIANGHIDRTAIEYSRASLITSSCAVIAGLKGGTLYLKTEPGKHCTPTFDPSSPRAVKAIEILYQFPREQQIAQGMVTTKLFWYRRVIDDQADTVYKEVPVENGTFLPEWEVDPEQTVKHKLGFCPVIWVRSLPVSTDAVDGQPFIDPALYGMIDRINYTLSQRDRAVEYQQDPQMITKGVPKADRGVFRKGSGQVWHLDEKSSAEILELKGSGQNTASDHLNDMHSRFLEAARVVLIDPKDLKGTRDLSGQVIENLYAPMQALAADLRKDFGTDAFVDLLNLCLRLCVTVTQRGQDVWIPGVAKITKLVTQAQLRGTWLPFPIQINYPPPFSPNAQDQNLKIVTAVQAVQAGLISKATARAFLTDVFGITDVDAEGDQADQDKQDDMKAMADMMPAVSQPKGSPQASVKAPAPAKPPTK